MFGLLGQAIWSPFILSLKRKNVTFETELTRVHVEKGKTAPRSVAVIGADPLLANWLESARRPADALTN